MKTLTFTRKVFAIIIMAVCCLTFTKMSAQTIQIDSTFTSDGEIFPFGPNDTIFGLSISGHVTLLSDTSLVRVILTDNSGNEWMVYEAYPMIVHNLDFDIEEECDETRFLEEFHPYSLKIQIIAAEITISFLSPNTIRYENLLELQDQAKKSRDLVKVQSMNQYIVSKGWNWIADTNELVNRYYHEKVNHFYYKYNLLGRDYYSEGSYYSILHTCVPQYNDNSIIPSFDWREKHRANVPYRPYWDQDPDDDEEPGNGWMTGLRSQSFQSCSAFASIASLEAAIYLYANYQFDVREGGVENPVRFSERDAFVCSSFNGDVGCDCRYGKEIKTILNKIQIAGVVNEGCFPQNDPPPYCPGTIPNCSPPNTSKCTDPDWTAQICDWQDFDLSGFNSQTERSNYLKELILENGPLTIEIRTTHNQNITGHAVSLIGFEFNPNTGQIDWIYKNSAPKSYCYEPLYLGIDGNYTCPYIVNKVYSFVYDETCEEPITITPIESGFKYKVHENDFDKDGYYNWGIGRQPNTYLCSQEEDCNDDDNSIGPYEEDYSGRPIKPIVNVQRGIGPIGFEIIDGDVINLGEENNSEEILYPFQINNLGNAQLNLEQLNATGRGKVTIENQYPAGSFEIKGTDLPDTSVCWNIENNYTIFYITMKANADPGALAHIHIYFEDDQDLDPEFEFTLIYNPCQTDAGYYSVESEETWDVEMSQLKDVRIASNGVLTITGTVFLSPEADIIVEPGGTLIIDGGKLTNSCKNQLWNGIQVLGSNHCQSFPEYFGQVYLKNHAVIENAKVAISNYELTETLQTGGIIYATDATFRNNQIAVHYLMFKNMYLGQEHPYRSQFTKCKFEFDQNEIQGLNFEYFIKMDRVNGIQFYGCDFTNSIDLTASHGELQEKFGTGIYSIGSQFYVDQTCISYPVPNPCTEFKRSTFTGLNYGIYAMGIDAIHTISVNKSIFKNNVTGVYLSGIENATVTLNDFHVNKKYITPPVPYDTYVGLYLDGCTGFHIEENYFVQDDDYEFHNTGMVVKDAGVNFNEIYNNFFTTRFEVGITALNKNKGSDQFHGLQIKCNQFTELGPFTSDILVHENGIPTINSGIAQNQGSGATASSPAGNLFSRNSQDAWKDYVNQIDRTRIDYFMNDTNSVIRVKPKWYTQNVFPQNTHIPINKESCNSHLTKPDPNPDPPHLKAELESFALKIDSAQTELTTWVDGGNTEQLVSDVTFSIPPEAYELYSDLILKSPYLSDTVLKESIQKEDVLDNVMIEDILVANPQSAKSAEIQKSLDEKIFLLTEDQRGTIDQGNYFISGKEILESRLAWNNHCRAMILDNLITFFKNDTVNAYAKDSLKALLNDENDPALLYQLAYIWLNEGDSAEAWNILNNIDDSFNFNPAQLELHQQYVEYAKQYSEIINSVNPAFPLDSISRSTLYVLQEQKTFPGVYSRNVLQFFDTLLYVEPYIIPPELEKTGIIPTNHKVMPKVSTENFRIYPNPSKSYFIAEYSFEITNWESLELFISDISGCILKRISLNGNPGHKIISTKDFKPGLYFCKFVINGKEKQVIKLSVVK
jgi:hypothetical protein